MGLKSGLSTGEILMNLDTEEDDEIDIGCVGGMMSRLLAHMIRRHWTRMFMRS
ncbi:MAG: hypothetical protein IPN89_18470 [Saprospiraceae bacterium]|nr:hypothetical protein [Saprospiraceae bacterium]